MTSPKARRHREILSLVSSELVRTHVELANALGVRGISVSQGTLSRDLRELGVVKTPEGYVPASRLDSPPRSDVELVGAIAQFLVDGRTAQNLVVLITRPGSAGALAQFLDAARWPEILGTVAGDDTIFVATADSATARSVLGRLGAL